LQPTKSKMIKHTSCDKCGSSDANTLYEDESMYCFSCETYTPPPTQGERVVTIQQVTPQYQPSTLSKGQVEPLADRKISADTCRRYGVTILNDKQVYPYYDTDGKHVANKVRQPNKQFHSEGNMPHAALFGQQLFQQSGKYITITEGEVDALSAYQMLGSKWPVVSVRNGAQSAVKDIKQQFEYLSKFDNIVLCFDMDEHGKKAAAAVAQIFEPNKCRIMQMGMKDANEYLKANQSEMFTKCWWEARPFTPAGILNMADYEGLYDDDNSETVLYPYKALNEMLYGIRTGELVTFTAGTGAGKSSIMRELQHHILNNSEHNIGVISLEENVKQSIFHLMSVEASKRLYIKEVREQFTIEQLREWEKATVGTRRFFAFDHFGSIQTDEILARVRYMVKALDCKFIFIDHLSILVSGLEGEDERRNIDQMMTKLRSLVEETQCAVLLVSHLRRTSGDKGQEQGKEVSLSMLRGSHSIAQISDAVIALERDQQASDPVVANTTTVRVLKNRYSGETGIGTYLLYDRETGRMTEIDDPNAEDFETIDVEEYL